MPAYDFSAVHTLVVDDNDHMRQLLRAMLHAFGMRHVEEAADGAAAIAALNRGGIDLIFTDLAMAPVDGLGFTRLVRALPQAHDRQVPIILLTGHTERRRITEARDAGANEVLAKPISAASLFDRIAAVVERPRPFVQAPTYVGPCRRRRADPAYTGAKRRWDEADALEVAS